MSLKIKLRGTAIKTIWRNHKWGQVKVVTGAWNRRKITVEKQFQTNVFSVFVIRKVAIVSNDNRKLISNCWCSYTESIFANIQLRFRNEKLFGNG